MTSFKKLMQRQAEMMTRLAEFSEIEEGIVENIIQYAKNLVKPGTQEITDNTFTAQMMSRFHITNQFMVNQMFEAMKSRTITLEDFCLCICIFLTTNIHIKIDWVFSVYDANGDGLLNKMEMYCLLKSCVLHSEEMDTEEAIKDLIDIVLTVVDLDKNGSIDLYEFSFNEENIRPSITLIRETRRAGILVEIEKFDQLENYGKYTRELVKRNVLYIDLLGQCLPNEHVLTRFVKKMKNKTPMEVAEMFEKELDKALVIPTVTPESNLYPIHLDLP